MDNELEVSYSVKELIKGLSDRIDAFMQMMANKADQSTVAQVQLRIDQHETRLARIEHHQENEAKQDSASSEFKRWLIPVLLSIVPVAVLLMQVFHL